MKLFIRDEVVEDVEGIKRHIAADNVEAANRFGPVVLAASDVLLAFPYIGRPRTFNLVAGVRSWGVPGFRNYLIFYRVKSDAVDVLAVLEGHRDTAAILRKR
ncbi:MAG: toxin ParE1/3/4 [Verrucomicrobiota bacterium]|jgi:toxin ParE1/3/4